MKHGFLDAVRAGIGHLLRHYARAEAAAAKLSQRTYSLFVATILILSAHSAFAPTNLVYNPNFDTEPWGWFFDESGFGYNPGYIRVYGRMWQDLQTVPGENYVVRFAWGNSLPRLHWDTQIYDTFTNSPVPSSWTHVYRFVTATTNPTRLQFETTSGLTSIDNVLVGSLGEPVRILTQPQGRSTLEGATVSFSVQADGGPPLHYRWFFNDQPVPGAANSYLIRNNVGQADQGGYHVIVSNVANAVTSSVVQLTVDPQPTTPIIVLQPEGTTIPAGYPG